MNWVDEDKEAKIKKLWQQGLFLHEIADELRIAQATVVRSCRRQALKRYGVHAPVKAPRSQFYLDGNFDRTDYKDVIDRGRKVRRIKGE